MRPEQSDALINEIIQLSKLTRTGLDKKIERFFKLYEKEKKDYSIILKQSDQRQKQMRQQQNELEALKEELEQRVEKETERRLEKEKMLEHQSRMAAIGEMMDAVAHQWKQPLNSISLLSDLLRSDFSDGLVDQAYVDDATETIHQQIDHLVSTLAEFRTFFRPDKEPEPFGIKRSLQSVQLLVKDEFMKHGIDLYVDSTDEIIIQGIENEFKHVILNIINNAKDAFNERTCEKREIHIVYTRDTQRVTIDIEDTAGGIPEEVIGEIFKPNVTTKEGQGGTGIGLYMSSQIVSKHNGTLRAENSAQGAKFIITLPL